MDLASDAGSQFPRIFAALPGVAKVEASGQLPLTSRNKMINMRIKVVREGVSMARK
jgi:hypothetical protein